MRLGLLVSRTYTGFDRPFRNLVMNDNDIPVDDCTNNDIDVKHVCDDVNNNIDNIGTGYNSENRDNDNDNHYHNVCNDISNSDRIKFNPESKINYSNKQKNDAIKKGNITNNQNTSHDINDVTIQWFDDIYDTYNPSNTTKNDEKPFCLTDGCGFISLNLAMQLPSYIRQGILNSKKGSYTEKNTQIYCSSPRENNKNNNKINRNNENDKNNNLNTRNQVLVPSAYQVRIISPLGVFKGTLVTHPTLPPNTIIVRHSMHKVQGPKNCKKNFYQSTDTSKRTESCIKISDAVNNKNQVKIDDKDEGKGKDKDNMVVIDDEMLLIEYDKIMEKLNRQNASNDELIHKNSESKGTRNLDLDSIAIDEGSTIGPRTSNSTAQQTQHPPPLPSSSSLPFLTRSTMSTVSLQIVNTSNPLKQYRCNLNKHLILLLNHMGVPFHIFESKLR